MSLPSTYKSPEEIEAAKKRAFYLARQSCKREIDNAKTPEEKKRAQRRMDGLDEKGREQGWIGQEGFQRMTEKLSKPIKKALEEDMASAKDKDVVEVLNEILREEKRQTKLLETLSGGDQYATKKHSRV